MGLTEKSLGKYLESADLESEATPIPSLPEETLNSTSTGINKTLNSTQADPKIRYGTLLEPKRTSSHSPILDVPQPQIQKGNQSYLYDLGKHKQKLNEMKKEAYLEE